MRARKRLLPVWVSLFSCVSLFIPLSASSAQLAATTATAPDGSHSVLLSTAPSSLTSPVPEIHWAGGVEPSEDPSGEMYQPETNESEWTIHETVSTHLGNFIEYE